LDCALSEADLTAILRDSIEELGDKRQRRDIVECAIAKADYICRELSAGVAPEQVEVPSCEKARKARR